MITRKYKETTGRLQTRVVALLVVEECSHHGSWWDFLLQVQNDGVQRVCKKIPIVLGLSRLYCKDYSEYVAIFVTLRRRRAAGALHQKINELLYRTGRTTGYVEWTFSNFYVFLRSLGRKTRNSLSSHRNTKFDFSKQSLRQVGLLVGFSSPLQAPLFLLSSLWNTFRYSIIPIIEIMQ